MSDTNTQENPQNIPDYPGNYYPYHNQGNGQPLPKQAAIEMRNKEIERMVPKRAGHSWNSFQIRPKATFATQNQDEKIYVLSRRHWIVNVGWISRNIIYSLIPIIVIILINVLNIPIPMGAIADRIYLISILAFYSIILTNVVRDFFDWYFDPYLVTNERVLDFTFNPFTNYGVVEAPLESIESVKQDTKGIVGAMFNYGDITIHTEAITSLIEFESAANPDRVRDIISDLSKIARTYSYGD